MVTRLFVYTLLVSTVLSWVHVKHKMERQLQRQEYDYLVVACQTKIRTYYVEQRLIDKEILRLRKVLGKWNSELNPYE